MLDSDDVAQSNIGSHLICFPQRPAGDQANSIELLKDYPKLFNPDSTGLKATLVNHKIAETGNKLDVNLDSGVIIETGKEGSEEFLSICSLTDKPLVYLDIGDSVKIGETKLTTGYLDREDKNPTIMICKKDLLTVIDDPSRGVDNYGKLDQSEIENDDEIYRLKRPHQGVESISGVPLIGHEMIVEIVKKENQLSLLTFIKEKGKSEEIALKDVAVPNVGAIRAYSLHQVVGLKTFLQVLSAAGDLVVAWREPSKIVHSLIKIQGCTEFHYSFFNPETRQILVLGTTAEGSKTKVTIFGVEVSADKFALSKETQVAQFTVNEPSAAGLKFGAIPTEDKLAFVLIFGNGNLYRVEAGKVTKETPLCDTKIAQVKEVRRTDPKDKKKGLLVALQSSADCGPVRVFTVCKVTLN